MRRELPVRCVLTGEPCGRIELPLLTVPSYFTGRKERQRVEKAGCTGCSICEVVDQGQGQRRPAWGKLLVALGGPDC